jgi:hypothetical protein
LGISAESPRSRWCSRSSKSARPLGMFKQLKIRLQLWFLRLLARVVAARWFQDFALRPVIRVTVWVWLYWFAWAAIFDRLPKGFGESDPKIAQMMITLRAQRDARVAFSSTDRDRAVNQAITWGTAGVGALILTTIVTTRIFNPAILIAAGCFSLSLPLLVVIGFLYALHADPKQEPPTLQDSLSLFFLLWTAHFIFDFGFAAFLWSYDFRVSIVFAIGCYIAWRYFRRFSAKVRVVPQENKTDKNG